MSRLRLHIFKGKAHRYFHVTVHVVAGIILLFLIALLTKEILRQRKKLKSKLTESRSSAFGVLSVVALLALCLSNLTGVSSLLASSLLHAPCELSVKVLGAATRFSKSIMYSIFLSRVDVVYGTTAYAYNQRLIYSLMALMWVLNMAMLLSYIVFDTIDGFPDKGRDGYPRVCLINLPVYFHPVIIAEDVFFSIACLQMFTRPLRAIMRQCNRYGGDQNDDYIDLMKKYTVLMWTSIMTTLLSFTLEWLFAVTIVAVIDMVVNACCLTLMINTFDGYYKPMCCLSIWGFNRITNTAAKTKDLSEDLLSEIRGRMPLVLSIGFKSSEPAIDDGGLPSNIQTSTDSSLL